MFSPDMFRYIIDPDKITEENVPNKRLLAEKHVFRYNILDHEKVLSDYSFFSRILKNFHKVFEVFASQTR
ncbi:MAG: hypothetical protein WCG23_06010 [bacterium]